MGFGEDPHLIAAVRGLIKEYSVQSLVETGTLHGDTTVAMAQWGLPVCTIEIIEEQFDAVGGLLSRFSNVNQYLGSSPVVLDEILPGLERPILFFLDAHWYEYNPLKDELKTIGKHAPNSLVVIHDFEVPGRPELGFDWINGLHLDYGYIEEMLPLVYPSGWSYHYNSIAMGMMRGVIFLYPKWKRKIF